MNYSHYEMLSSTNQALSTYFWAPDGEPVCILFIVHGMCEHMKRYDDFARFLAQKQIAVIGLDLPGHGASAQEGLGFFAKKYGYQYAAECILQLKDTVKETFPSTPLFLMGHSMGSFFARYIAAQNLSDIDGYIFSGTAGPNIATAIGKALARGQMLFMGKKHPGTLLQNMAFKLYNKPFFPNRTPFDWLSRDENAVDRYIADEKCGFVFTVSGFYDLFSLLQTVSLPHWATRFDRTKPYLLLSGLMDPVGSMGKGVQKVYDRMREAKIKNLSLLLYPHGRHEMLNEVNKTEVYEDIYAFIKKNILGAGHEN